MRETLPSLEFRPRGSSPSPVALRAPASPRTRGEAKAAPPLHLSPRAVRLRGEVGAAGPLHLAPPAGRGRIASAIRVRGSLRKRGRYRLPTSSRTRGKAKAAPSLHLSPLAGRGRIASAIPPPPPLRERGRYRFENARQIRQHVVIPESQNTIVVIGKPSIADHIARVVGVLAAVHLDNQAVLTADKVDRISTDWFLANELVTAQVARAQAIPQSSLGVGGNLSQVPGSPGLHLVSSSQAETPPHPDCFAIRPLPARGERLAPRMKT